MFAIFFTSLFFKALAKISFLSMPLISTTATFEFPVVNLEQLGHARFCSVLAANAGLTTLTNITKTNNTHINFLDMHTTNLAYAQFSI
jgi:hypothetical protein